MLGLVTRDEAAGLLARARAAVVPSAWEETFGLVAVESMAVGTPAIVAAHGALPELVTDGRDGALFPPRDVAALADLFADVEDCAQRWAVMGRQARGTYSRAVHRGGQRRVASRHLPPRHRAPDRVVGPGAGIAPGPARSP